jgi:hypothetical protein
MEMQRFIEKGWKLLHLPPPGRCKMLMKAFEQPLGNAKGVLENCWETPKGYWISSE